MTEKHPNTTEWHRKTLCIAFRGIRRIAEGELAHVARRAKISLERNSDESIFIFDNLTSEPIEIDFRGSMEEVLSRIPAKSSCLEDTLSSGHANPTVLRGPGRPKLGVVAREVTLLPRHWTWLNSQPGGCSVALRKLVEAARHGNEGRDRKRTAQEASYRFMSAMAGNLPGFEEATRALFAGDRKRFEARIEPWPAGVRNHAKKLAEGAFLHS